MDTVMRLSQLPSMGVTSHGFHSRGGNYSHHIVEPFQLPCLTFVLGGESSHTSELDANLPSPVSTVTCAGKWGLPPSSGDRQDCSQAWGWSVPTLQKWTNSCTIETKFPHASSLAQILFCLEMDDEEVTVYSASSLKIYYYHFYPYMACPAHVLWPWRTLVN